MVDIPFGNDPNQEERRNLSDGTYLFQVTAKSRAEVSRAGNPMVVWRLQAIESLDSAEEVSDTWPVRHYTVISGGGSGLIKPILRSLLEDEDVDSFLERKWAEYVTEYGEKIEAATAVEFFNFNVLPEVIHRVLQATATLETAISDSGDVITSAEGEPITNVRLSNFRSPR